jgi:hypothetical protein
MNPQKNEQRWPMFRSFSFAAGLAFALNTFSGCMLAPTDDGYVSSTSAALPFSGMHTEPGAPVQVEAWNYSTNAFAPVGASVRSATERSAWVDEPVFPWSTSLVLGPSFWRVGPRSGSCAVVGATSDVGGSTYPLLTVERDWIGCWGRTGNVGRFAASCTSDHTPHAMIYTRDWTPIEVTAEQLQVAGAIASTQVVLMIDNFTPNAYEFCSGATPEGCPNVVSPDPETYKFYKPGGSFLRTGDATMTFSVTPIRQDGKPYTTYIDDLRSSGIDFRVSQTRFILGIDFETVGTELRFDCIRNGICGTHNPGSGELAAPRAELQFQLETNSGRIRYREVSVTFTLGAGSDPDRAVAIGDVMTRMLREDANIRSAISNALDVVLRTTSGVTDAYPLRGIALTETSVILDPACPMD